MRPPTDPLSSSATLPAAPAAASFTTTWQAEPAAAEQTPGVAAITATLANCLIPASDLDTVSIPRRRRHLDEWLCEADLGYVFAARGVGKTWLAMALPAAISQAAPLGLWQSGETTARILYVDGEMPLELTQARSRGLNLAAGDVHYLHHETVFDQHHSSLNIGLPAHREALTALIVERKFEVLILDNLSSLACGVQENKGEDYEPIGQWLLDLRRRRITVIVIHHAGRNQLMRGHSKREDACSWILELRDAKADDEPGAKFTSHFAKPSRNTGRAMPDLLWHFTTGRDGAVVIDCQVAEAGGYAQFIEHIADGVDRQKDLAALMGKPEGTISKWTKKALGEGRISRCRGRLVAEDGGGARERDGFGFVTGVEDEDQA